MKDLTLKNLTVQHGSTFPLWAQKGWAEYLTLTAESLGCGWSASFYNYPDSWEEWPTE